MERGKLSLWEYGVEDQSASQPVKWIVNLFPAIFFYFGPFRLGRYLYLLLLLVFFGLFPPLLWCGLCLYRVTNKQNNRICRSPSLLHLHIPPLFYILILVVLTQRFLKKSPYSRKNWVDSIERHLIFVLYLVEKSKYIADRTLQPFLPLRFLPYHVPFSSRAERPSFNCRPLPTFPLSCLPLFPPLHP